MNALPEDVAKFLEGMTSYRESVNAGTPNEWGECVREAAETAAELCDKYKVLYQKEVDYDEDTVVMSDGTVVPEDEWYAYDRVRRVFWVEDQTVR